MAEATETIGPYVLLHKIGRGKFGVVWLAEKRTSIVTTQFALKLAANEDIDLTALTHEAAIWVKASGHPNVLTLVEADVYGERVVIVSEYARDGSLTEWLQQHGGKSPSVEAAVEITLQILSGLEHLHKHRIIHRDIKPDNILLQHGTAKLADFGLARLLKNDSYSQAIRGTLAYMAPEAFNRKRNEQTDIWSVGVVLYQMLSGRLPYDEPDLTSLIGALLSREPAPLPLSVPDSLLRIVRCALHRDPTHRYKLAADMRRDVLAFRQEIWQSALVSTMQVERSGEVKPQGAAPTVDQMPRPINNGDESLSESNAVNLPQPDAETLIEPSPSGPIMSFEASQIHVLLDGGRTTKRSRLGLRKIPLAWLGITLAIVLSVWGVLHWRGAIPSIWTNENEVNKKEPHQISSSLTTGESEHPATTPAIPQLPEAPSWIYDQTFIGHNGEVNAVAFSTDGATVASGSDDKTIKIWDVTNGSLKQTIKVGWEVRSLAFSTKLLASGSNYWQIKLWDVTNGKLTKTLYGHDGSVLGLAFSLDGTLASASCDETIKLWNTQNAIAKLTIRAQNLNHCLLAVAFSPDATMVVSAGGYIKLWDAGTGVLKRTLAGHREGIAAVVFSPDGKTLASAGCDKTIKLWDVQSGQLLKTLSDHTDCVMTVDFSPDGKTLASGSKDKTIKLWDPQTGIVRQTLTGHEGVVWQVVFSADGSKLASGSSDKSVKLWKLKS